MLGRTLVLIIALLCMPNVSGDQGLVYLFGKTPNNEATDFIMVGESEIFVNVMFPEDCIGYELLIRDSLFKEPVEGFTYTNRSAGEGHFQSLKLNETTVPGNYSINCTFSYIKRSNETVRLSYVLPLRVIKPLDIVNITIPSGLERTFSILVRLNLALTRLDVVFDSDGDIDLTNKTFSSSHLSPGEYYFSSELNRSDGRGPQELSYHIIGMAFNRSFEMASYNMPVRIQWEEDSNDPDQEEEGGRLGLSIAIRLLIIVVLIMAIVWVYRHQRKPVA